MARTKSIDDDLLLDRLTEVFRTYGYEGANLGRISDATGLKRASLYHRFPDGKAAMAEAVLDRAAIRVVEEVVAPLRGPGTARERLVAMGVEIHEFYLGGRMSCLLDSMSFGGVEAGLKGKIESAIGTWVEHIAVLVREAGIDGEEARWRAIDAIIRVQGSLVFARATGDTEPFRRTLATLPDSILEGAAS